MTRSDYLLVLLMEECAEVSKAAAKALRFGLAKTADKTAAVGIEYDNAADLRTEIVDVLAAVELLEEEGVISVRDLDLRQLIVEKKRKVERYLTPVRADHRQASYATALIMYRSWPFVGAPDPVVFGLNIAEAAWLESMQTSELVAMEMDYLRMNQ